MEASQETKFKSFNGLCKKILKTVLNVSYIVIAQTLSSKKRFCVLTVGRTVSNKTRERFFALSYKIIMDMHCSKSPDSKQVHVLKF